MNLTYMCDIFGNWVLGSTQREELVKLSHTIIYLQILTNASGEKYNRRRDMLSIDFFRMVQNLSQLLLLFGLTD